MLRPQSAAALWVLLAAACAASAAPKPAVPLKGRSPAASPPVAQRRPVSQTLHGDTRVDDYAWLRQRQDPEVRSYLAAENAYTTAVMGDTAALQRQLYQQTLARIQQTDSTVPVRRGDFEYYHRTHAGKQYRTHCRRRPKDPASEAVILDENRLAQGHAFLGLGAFEVSDDGRYLAYSVDFTGFREYRLRVRDLETGEDLPWTVQGVGSVAWAADGRSLFYTIEDEQKRSYRVYRRALDAQAGTLVLEESDQRFSVYTWRSRSKAFVVIGSYSHTTSELRVVPAAEPGAAPRVLAPRLQDQEYDVEHFDDHFYIRVNDEGRNFRVVRAPVDTPQRAHWQEVVPHRQDVMVSGLAAVGGRLVLTERQGGLKHLRVLPPEGGSGQRVPLPDPVYELVPAHNPSQDTSRFRFTYESLNTPESVYEYDLESAELTLLKRTTVLGGFDPAHYRVERLHATAADGTRIPISLVSRADQPKGVVAPMLLRGYGAYGLSFPLSFSHARIALLERGVRVAIAHVRGGGELGKPWHDGGRMEHKQNSFTDFIAVAEHLIDQGYTVPERLAIEGGSAGGLLMGAVTNLRPDLFRAVLAHVPFVDVLNTMLDASLPLTVGEYEEWGNPNEPAAYWRIRRYCPYTNLRADDYPAMLVTTSFHDSQVMYWEPAKYIAKLRTLNTGARPVLLKTNLDGGHGGSSGRYDRIEERAFEQAFILSQLGAVGN